MRIKDEFLKQSSVMFLAIGFANFLNLAFHLFMVRNLSTVDYGILNSLLAVFMIISVPAVTIQTVIAKFASHFRAIDRSNNASFLIRHLGKRVILLSLILFLIFVITRNYLAGFLKLPGNVFILLLGASLSMAVIVPVCWGSLQGLQKFNLLGLNIITGNAIKLCLGVALVLFGFKIIGVLGALILAGFSQLILSYIFLKPSLRTGHIEPVHFGEIYKFFYPVALAHLCFVALTNTDIILVKHFFSPSEAGQYSVASLAGKIILFLPAAINTVMFPKASGLHAAEKSSFHIYKRSLLYSGGLCAACGSVFMLYPGILARLLSVEDTGMFIPLVRMFVIAMTFFAMIYVIVNYNLSVHRFGFLYILGASLLAQLLLISFYHKNLLQVLFILAVNACVLFVINLWAVNRYSKKGYAR